MKDIHNSYIPYIVICVLLLALGVSIGLNFSKKEVVLEKNETVSESSIANSKENSVDKNIDNNDYSENENANVDIIEENSSNVSSTNATSGNNSTSNTVSESKQNTSTIVTYSTNDQTVIGTLEDTLTQVNNASNDSNFASSAKATFINIVDFLFYGGTIKGVTFSELTDAGKTQVLKIASKIDEAIEAKIPGYKESISTTASGAFKKASEVIKAGASNLNNFAYEKLGEENYNAIIAAKDELVTYTKNAISFVGSVGSNLFSSAKDKLNNWYQNFKNGN